MVVARGVRAVLDLHWSRSETNNLAWHAVTCCAETLTEPLNKAFLLLANAILTSENT